MITNSKTSQACDNYRFVNKENKNAFVFMEGFISLEELILFREDRTFHPKIPS